MLHVAFISLILTSFPVAAISVISNIFVRKKKGITIQIVLLLYRFDGVMSLKMTPRTPLAVLLDLTAL